ncbi:acyltransferase family protein [Glutamicibacter bergerei]
MPSSTKLFVNSHGAYPETSRRSNFRPDIQGLRAIAVLLVVLYHSGVPGISGGYVGVDVFFVISGFLITTHLLDSLDRTGRVQFARFYAKRARRILPASLLVAALTVIAASIWMPPLLIREVLLGAVATAAYVPNMLFAVQGTNYLSEPSPSAFQHYWSLGIEEQFYVFWPIILALGFWVFKRKERALFVAVAVLTVGSFLLCLVGMNISQSWTFFSLPTRAWELGVGGLVAFLMRSGVRWLPHAATGILSWIGMAGLLTAAFAYDSTITFPGFNAALPVLATALLIIGGSVNGGLSTSTVLGWRHFQQVGAISYSLYLVHWPLQVIPQAAVGLNNTLPLWGRLLLGLVAFPLAWAVYRFIEQPAMKWNPIAQGRPLKTGLAAIAASAVVVLLASGSFIAVKNVPLASTNIASEAPPKPSPTGSAFVPSNLTPALRGASSDNPPIYADGCHRGVDSSDASGCRIGTNGKAPLVFLFGDSHAASWYPALAVLAERGDIRLDSNTKSSCHSVDASNLNQGVEYTACETWRAGVIERIRAEQPALVLLANYGDSQLVSDAPFIIAWQEGLERTLAAMSSTSVAVIADVPDNGATPAICLSAHVDNVSPCLIPRGEQLRVDVAAAEKDAAANGGAAFVDFNAYLCNKESCPPIIGNLLVYRDAHHLTATFSRQMSEVVWKKIEPLVLER